MRELKYIPVVLILFFSVYAHSWSQDIELTVQTGHSSAINAIAFSPGDDLIASGGSDNKIILWDFLTAKQADVFTGHTGFVTDLIFHPDEKKLFSSSLDSTVKIWDLFTGECLQTLRFNYPVYALDFMGNGLFATAGKEISLFSYPALTKKTLPLLAKKNFTAVSFSKDGNLIAFGGKQEDLAYVVNLSEKSVVKKVTAAFTDVTFDETNERLIYTTNQGIGGELLITQKGKKSTNTDWMLNSYNAVACNKTHLFMANDLGEIRVIQRSTFQEKNILKSAHTSINALKISHNHHFLASAGNDGRVVVWDLSTNHAVKDMEGSVTQINAVAFSPDGTEILVGYQDGSLRKTNLFSNQSLLNSPLPASEIINNRFTWSVYEIEQFEKDSAVLIMHKKRYALDEENAFDKITQYQVIWYFKENVLTLTEQDALTPEASQYMADRKQGIRYPVTFLLNPELTTATTKDKGLTATAQWPNVTIYRGKSLNPQQLNSQHTDRITALAINETFGFFATAGWDGLIRFRDLESGKLLTTFGAFSDGQFIYINPDGYYFSSKKALDYVGFRLNQKLYSFEQFDLIYNRPDLVAAYLPYYDEYYVSAYKKAYQKRLAKLNLTEADLTSKQEVPLITYQRSLDQLLTTGKISLAVQCSDAQNELDKLHIRVNGVPEFGRFGKSISGHEFHDSVEIELNPGTNYIQLYCTNKSGISSLQESFSVEAHKKDMVTDLYLVSIGVSNYRESQYNLNYARKDAEDMVRYFNRPFGPFNAVYTKLLVDTTITLSNIYKLNEFLSAPKPNDVVMVFVAGHGVLDLKFDYYLATHDMDFKNPAGKGIPYELFEELLDNTRSRKKVLFLDACHSGEIDKEEVIKSEVLESEQGDIRFRSAGINIANKEQTNSLDLAKSLFADMRLNNGTTVISSAGGTEFAIESENWRNGAFTYCLLYGLSSGSADLNKNKQITLSELQDYLLFQVNKITNGVQTPTSRVENLNNDFRVK
ncbi:MAG: caspase family protein [Bacteroidetes bacterium]|nr:caspase family protein [Bacteroidota bacterium]